MFVLLASLPAARQGKTFVEDFVRIYNRSADEKIDRKNVFPRAGLDSLRREEATATGERLSELRRQIALFDNLKEMRATSSAFDLAPISERDRQKIDLLIAGYTELMRFSREGSTTGYLPNSKGRKKSLK